ncbi:MAG TPA: MazG-like family protein [Candidatus Saccharimonadales bacterium]|nr:MazG-like family protein [Candidatus Saccharimonadales bacterium]
MPKTTQQAVTFEEINQLIQAHLEARDWQNNPPRGLAISIALEANELLEHYQWSDESVGSREELASELADIFIYAFQFAQANNINIVDAIQQKIEKSAQKYPAEQFKGKTHEQKRKAWLNSKLQHRKEGL